MSQCAQALDKRGNPVPRGYDITTRRPSNDRGDKRIFKPWWPRAAAPAAKKQGGVANGRPQQKLDKCGNPVPTGYSYGRQRQAVSGSGCSSESASASSGYDYGSSSSDNTFDLLNLVIQLSAFDDDDCVSRHDAGSSSSHHSHESSWAPWSHSSSSDHTHHDTSYDSSVVPPQLL